MNKDEMIKDMAKIANFSAFDFTQGTIQSKTIYTAIAEAHYNAGYRKVADDEIVIKKREYEQLKKHNRDRKRLRLKWQIAEQEKREILQDIMTRITYLDTQFLKGIKYFYVNKEYIEELAKKYGIELEAE